MTDCPQRLSDLFTDQKKRERTLNVDEDTYNMITRVSIATGKSRPKVLASFVAAAYELFRTESAREGIKLDDIDVSSSPKLRRSRKRIPNDV